LEQCLKLFIDEILYGVCGEIGSMFGCRLASPLMTNFVNA
jgi:hypothetical protein